MNNNIVPGTIIQVTVGCSVAADHTWKSDYEFGVSVMNSFAGLKIQTCPTCGARFGWTQRRADDRLVPERAPAATETSYQRYARLDAENGRRGTLR